MPKREIIRVDSTPSTNSFFQKVLDTRSLPEGSVVIASDQTEGRGQFGSPWWSERDKSLTASMLLYPKLQSLEQLFSLNVAVSLGVRDFVHDLTRAATTIKWPNDILCDGKKMAGILIENAISQHAIRYSIVGIGMNVNQQEFPEDIVNATSVLIMTHRRLQVEELVEPLCKAIEHHCAALPAGEDELWERYHTHLYGLGEVHEFSADDQKFRATISGVSRDGRLQLQTENEARSFAVKEVVLVA